ncbi:hypothetical protein D3C75_1063060 [compost metagenome]
MPVLGLAKHWSQAWSLPIVIRYRKRKSLIRELQPKNWLFMDEKKAEQKPGSSIPVSKRLKHLLNPKFYSWQALEGKSKLILAARKILNGVWPMVLFILSRAGPSLLYIRSLNRMIKRITFMCL